MIDKSLPYIGVLMTKTDIASYPHFDLPEGFSFSFYQPGYEDAWAELMLSVDQTDTLQEAKDIFRSEFLAQPELLPTQCLFALDEHNRVAATGSIWPGEHFGRELLRIHWVACAPEHQGKGLVKALMTKLMDITNALRYQDLLYLTSQTWSYKALGLYARFGFMPYKGEKPVNWQAKNFNKQTQTAWALIDKKLSEYKS